MAASSSSVPFFGLRDEDQNQLKQQHSSPATAQTSAPQKKKRNLPGNPNPDAEVIALSPKTLMATNRFICEVCNKGFQREQNLQLHRRGHNLPWKLRQKTTKETKRKVYLCPEPTCVHHDPSRALGDLTGIKKHYSRKHGEKKWKCEKCSKRYAVQSDWKAHSKTCGTREYRCDCGTLFSRRDSFITHRAFCDALAQESARHPTTLNSIAGSHLYGNTNMSLGISQLGPQVSPMPNHNHQPNDMLRLGGPRPGQFDHLMPPAMGSAFRSPPSSMPSSAFLMPEPNQDYHEEHQSQHGLFPNKPVHGLMSFSELQNNQNNPSSAANFFNFGFFPNTSGTNSCNNINATSSSSSLLIPNQFHSGNGGNISTGEGCSLFSSSLNMGDQITSGFSSLFSSTSLQNANVNVPHMSATALLQKAARMGSTSSGGGASLLQGLGSSSSAGPKSDRLPAPANFSSMLGENDNNLHDLMNSFATGSSSIFGGVNAYGTHEDGNPYQDGGYSGNRSSLGVQHHHHSPSFSNMEEHSLLQKNLSGSIGSSDRLTRDFLGVGEIVRSMSGGISQKEQQAGIDVISLDSERKTAQTSRSFGGGDFL
ncbi:protein indeterminate-domain 5, chloroplastic-like [Malania oleifera]|uniref:protein indeterminate-domain 5, chloroplastic-like n=1 Tax=Malania oleifera TaxID=397392 RepID=UPI0025AE3257|nr:protein indeterminate-domain 5, chloroplastic-like [Malania oleifera]